MIPTVNSRPGRNSSTMTGCLKSARRLSHRGQRSSRAFTIDRGVIPLLVPSATGFTKYGGSKRTASASARLSTSAKSGVAIPESLTTRFVIPLWSVSAITRGSEKV